MKIYTKTGDDGTTGLFNGDRVDKDSLRIEACGTVDELNCLIGSISANCPLDELTPILTRLQDSLFELGAQLATPPTSTNDPAANRIGPDDIQWLETQIDTTSAHLPALRQFILPGGGELAARFHLARAVCRRAERLCVTLVRNKETPRPGMIFLNRLSDLLFVLARRANQLQVIPDVSWNKKG